MIHDYTQQDANDLISSYLRSDKLFTYGRFGIGYETFIPYMIEHKYDYTSQLSKAHLHSGLYGNPSDIMYYYDKFIESINERDIFLTWGGGMGKYEDYFLNKYNKNSVNNIYVDAGTNESFRYSDPFTYFFEGKRVLVINNFTESIKKQWEIKDKLFKDPKVLPDFELITYKSVSSFLMNTPHSGWRESYERMVDDISKIEFDIALVGAGSYTQPIINTIKKMGKTAFNLGGGTPLYFGVMGSRWKQDKNIENVINKEYWITPLKEETPDNNKLIEGGCYW